jgi:hypothetical protein
LDAPRFEHADGVKLTIQPGKKRLGILRGHVVFLSEWL